MEYIRADANPVIATGHIMRCMAIGAKLREYKKEVTFITADEYPAELLRENGFKAIALGTDWRDMESELPALLSIIRERQIKRLLVDSYQVTEKYFHTLKAETSVMYMDDINPFYCEVGALVNYSSYYKDYNYNEIYGGKGVKLYLGCEYIPLRAEFQKTGKKIIRDRIGDVLITTGGTDSEGAAGFIAESLADAYKDINFHVAVGRFFKDIASLEGLEKEKNNIKLHKNVTKMSELMGKCDVAVSAGGTTLYELCACGIPSLCFSMADNQLRGVRAMALGGIMSAIGDIREDREGFKASLYEEFKKIEGSKVRESLSDNMRKLVDGEGAARIAKAFMSM